MHLSWEHVQGSQHRITACSAPTFDSHYYVYSTQYALGRYAPQNTDTTQSTFMLVVCTVHLRVKNVCMVDPSKSSKSREKGACAFVHCSLGSALAANIFSFVSCVLWLPKWQKLFCALPVATSF